MERREVGFVPCVDIRPRSDEPLHRAGMTCHRRSMERSLSLSVSGIDVRPLSEQLIYPFVIPLIRCPMEGCVPLHHVCDSKGNHSLLFCFTHCE